MPVIENSAAVLTLWACLGYLMGSVPFGILVARAFGLGNLRDIGSGNIGTTNVLRTGSKSAAALTLLLDSGKGMLAVLLARMIAGEDAAQVAALFAFLGHCFPVWLRFKGGKGVATFLGIFLVLFWPAGVACCATWLFMALVFRISSLAAITAAASSTAWLAFLGGGPYIVLGMLFTVLVFFTHRANIDRLRAGIEPKIGQK